MKSKIEKTEWKCPVCGTTKITPWYVKELEPELEGIYPETVKKIIEKVGKMLNDNSQDQEEDSIDREFKKFLEEKASWVGKEPEVEDTPEEWVKEFKFSYGHLYIQNEDGEFCKINGEVEDMIDFIRQLLEERVENVLEQIQDWLSSDKGGDMDDEYLNILIDDIEELKLNTKKK